MTRGLGLGAWGLGLLMAVWSPPFGGYPEAAQHEAHQAPKAPSAPQAPMAPGGVEPIRCWRQSSAGAITLGETFTVTLTCAVFESADAQVVPDESRLNVASIQMAPFEILGGGHPPDVRRDMRRFIQYDYQLRIISRDAIGQDLNVPPLPISYRIHSRVGAAATLEGRDLTYVLPMMPIRVLSLVPADADDIRDASEASLATVSALRSRSRMFQWLAYGLGAVALVVALFALVPLTRRRTAAAAGPDRSSARAVLTHAANALGDVQSRAAGGGWTDDLIAAALSVMRIVAAGAVGRELSQKPLPADGVVPDGRLLVRSGAIRAISVTVSSSITPDDVGRAAFRSAGAISVTRGHHLEGLHKGLQLFSSALYQKAPSREAAELNEAVRHAIEVARAVAAEDPWWKQWARR